jgi:predicted enzyme related to lactoylglutathione lyase
VESKQEADAVGCSILNVTFDCTDTELLARFWSAVTGWRCSKQDMPGNPFWLVEPPAEALPRLVFVETEERKRVKNRIHLDLLPRGSHVAVVARIQSLGGRIIDDRRAVSPGGWVVMADPEGNEFCIEGND